MKRLLVLIAAVALTACSTPRYAYNFDYHDYNAGRKAKEVKPIQVDPATLTASTDLILAAEPVEADNTTTLAATASAEKKTISRKEFREIKKLIKAEVREIKAKTKFSSKPEPAITKATAGSMDHDLKLAIIFGAVGLVGLLIGGNVMWVIGGIAMLIGVVFFVKWLIRQ